MNLTHELTIPDRHMKQVMYLGDELEDNYALVMNRIPNRIYLIPKQYSLLDLSQALINNLDGYKPFWDTFSIDFRNLKHMRLTIKCIDEYMRILRARGFNFSTKGTESTGMRDTEYSSLLDTCIAETLRKG